MATEIEAKMKVDDHVAITKRLEKVGAKSAGEYLERNRFFDTKDRDLLGNDRGVRLRSKLDTRKNIEKHILTYKGPRQKSKMKSREEIETEVSDPDAMIQILDQLGFELTLIFEKRRHTWKLDGCTIELDEVPMLGTFVEIEGPSEDAVLKMRTKLKLAEEKMISDSYIGMLTAHLKKIGSTHHIIAFEN